GGTWCRGMKRNGDISWRRARLTRAGGGHASKETLRSLITQRCSLTMRPDSGETGQSCDVAISSHGLSACFMKEICFQILALTSGVVWTSVLLSTSAVAVPQRLGI